MGRRCRFFSRILRITAVIGCVCVLTACGTTPSRPKTPRPTSAHSPADDGIQCAPYARQHSKVALYGDANTWWDQAKGRYARRDYPTLGAIMVLYQYAGPSRAHVAVIRNIDSDFEIRVDHANWLNDGRIYLADPVRDTNRDGSWQSVNVYNMQTGHWGSRTYAVQGFIGPDRANNDIPISEIQQWLRYARFAPVLDPKTDDQVETDWTQALSVKNFSYR